MINSHVNAKNSRVFTVELLSTNRSLLMIVASLLKLKALKKRSFVLAGSDTNRNNSADILFVDCDDELAMLKAQSRQQKNKQIPMIITSASGEERYKSREKNVYFLPKKRLGSMLLKLLDEITIQHFNCSPELEIGGSVPTGSLKPLIGKLRCEEAYDAREHGRVLVVDDSLSVRTQMKMVLDLFELKSDLVEDAETAMVNVERHDYDIIFLDVVLPKMDGYKACKIFKSKPRSKNTPVIMLTGKKTNFNKLLGVLAGCDRYLTKPVKAEQLRQELVKHVPTLATKCIN